MQPQRQHARNSIVSNAVTRGRLHNNVVQWRAQKGQVRAVIAPAKPTHPRQLISPRVQNLILWIVGIAAACIFGASKAGVL